MKIATVGSRGFKELTWVDEFIDALPVGTVLVSGGARGVDLQAQLRAESRGLACEIYKPDWSIGKHAGMLRNRDIVANADWIVAFWDRRSAGTQHSIQYAEYLHKPVTIVTDLESKREALEKAKGLHDFGTS